MVADVLLCDCEKGTYVWMVNWLLQKLDVIFMHSFKKMFGMFTVAFVYEFEVGVWVCSGALACLLSLLVFLIMDVDTGKKLGVLGRSGHDQKLIRGLYVCTGQ